MRKNIRINCLIENLIFLLSVNIVQFVTTYYHHRTVGEYRVSDIVFDAMFTVINASFFIIVFFKNRALFFTGRMKFQDEPRKGLLTFRWLSLIALKCVLDVILIYVGRISVEWKYIGTDFLTLAYWCFVYLIATKQISKIWKNKKHLLCALAVIVIAVGIAICYDVSLIEQYRAVHLKYTESSPCVVRLCKNLDYLHGVKTFILDTFITCVLIVFHITNEVDPEKENKPQRGDGFRVFMRCNLIGSLFVILFVVKMAVDPLSVLNNNGYESSGQYNHKKDGLFDCWVESTGILHGMVDFVEENCYYFEKNISLKKGDKLEKFTFADNMPGVIFSDMGKVMSSYTQFSIDGRTVYLYGNYAICYYENSMPVIVRIDSLNSCAQAQVVTALLKHLVEQGNLFVIEFGGEYLINYDSEFIEPYIKRYANGVFTESEKEWLTQSHYREDYIINIAKKLIV